MNKPLQRIPRSQLLAVTMSILAKQGGKCPICGKMINTKVAGRSSDYVADHDHKTGEIRGVLHRSCNAAEGKVANAAGAWGAKSMEYENIIPFVKGLVTYWENAEKYGTGMMYPEHKTDEQKKEATSLKRRKAYAANKAKVKVKENAAKR